MPILLPLWLSWVRDISESVLLVCTIVIESLCKKQDRTETKVNSSFSILDLTLPYHFLSMNLNFQWWPTVFQDMKTFEWSWVILFSEPFDHDNLRSEHFPESDSKMCFLMLHIWHNINFKHGTENNAVVRKVFPEFFF